MGYFKPIEELFPNYLDLSERLRKVLPNTLKVVLKKTGGMFCLMYEYEWIYHIEEVKTDNRLHGHILSAIQKSLYPFLYDQIIKEFVYEMDNKVTINKVNECLKLSQERAHMNGIPRYNECLQHHLGIKERFDIDKTILVGYNKPHDLSFMENIK